jgi:RsiW-degrading membrane proteinase PrsW (M82 family)
MFTLKSILVFFFAAIPAAIWLYVFLREHRLSKWLMAAVFVGGMIAAKLILMYQGYWDQSVNLIFFKVDLVDFRSNIEGLIAHTVVATFAIFLGVGAMEEFLKFWMMKFIGKNWFQSIDDVIHLSIVSALGFAFLENILYFSSNWDRLGAAGFLVFVLMRVTLVTMVHMLCSGILGYYFGMAYFASPVLKIQYVKKKRHPVILFFKKLFHSHSSAIYYDEMFSIGLVLAMVIHALYDFFFTIELKVLGIPMVIPIIFLYLFGGYWFLMRLLHQKDLNLKLGLVGTKVMPKEDFEKLLNEIQDLKEKMAAESPGAGIK